MSTIVDVARLANVSTSTVSHVVNGTRPVSAATRVRVERAIKLAAYSPHSYARALRRNRSDSVGLVVSDTSQMVFSQIIAGVENEARKSGLTLLLANSAEDPDRERESIEALLDRRVDGLLVAQVSGSYPAVLRAAHDADCPVVLMDRISGGGLDQVGVENRRSMQALTAHLIDLGHTAPALIVGDTEVWTIHERLRGFQDALHAAGLPCPPELIVGSGHGLTDGREVIRKLLAGKQRPSALIASSGLLTIGALRAIRDCGLDIPRDLAFASFDGISNAEFIEPRLTSVVQPASQLGRQAMKLLLRRLGDADAEPKTILDKPSIQHGTSCGCDGSEVLTVG